MQSPTRRLIVCLDSGDTIIDEGTEVKDKNDIVLKARCIPGAEEAVRELHRLGFMLIMIADGYRASFERVYHDNGMGPLFSARIYSEDVGAAKPDARMFEAALAAAGLTRADLRRMMMVGNNLARDIKGANRMGMISVHLAWTTRYPREPRDPEEIPRYTICEPAELVPLVLRLEAEMTGGRDGGL